jgi:hypothetical protein
MDQEVDVGPFVVGEKPAPLLYQFQDADGNPLNLTGYTVKYVVKERDGALTTFNASLTDPVNGKVTYTWIGTEFPTPGTYLSRFWVGNSTNRFASWLIKFLVADPLGAVPNI